VKTLSDILYKVNLLEVAGNMKQEVSAVGFDTRKIQPNSLFVAVKGTQHDGHKFISAAIDGGANAVVCEQFPKQLRKEITYIKVGNSASALALIAENFYNNPSASLKVIMVTGTNGKTTVATLLYRLFTQLGYRCGLLSTIENRSLEKVFPATHTTPDPVQISSLMREMVKAGCTYCFMEASSHAIHQHRLDGLQVTGAVFTNITHDHLDYHKTFKNYLQAKKSLFDQLPATAFALVNADDKNGLVMIQNTRASKHMYSVQGQGDFRTRILENTFDGMVLQIDETEVHSPLAGTFNAYNLLAIYGAAILLGEEKTNVLAALSRLQPAEGRFDCVSSRLQKIKGIVDYAHTPDALEKVLTAIRNIRTGNEKLITIIGCGGNRDRAKRPVMGRIASELSDQVILTSDNPRNEEPEAILQEIREGILISKKAQVLSIADRREAIRTAVSLAGKGDIILLAGKGHEKYQEVQGTRHPFDDKEILEQSFKQMNK
jgi:UDP-N-acetylmuramoyl-L-alanyl-D-glutamate--2,6-diaminopimelate ligase